jgi:hypothetical protein
MKVRHLLISTGLILTLIILASGHASAELPRYLHVTTVTMELNGTSAAFTVDYELDIIAKLYVLFLGSGSIEPVIQDLFVYFDDVKVTSSMQNHALVTAANVFYQDPAEPNNFYFHDSHQLGATVDKFILVFPKGTRRTLLNVSATPNIFFEI